MGPRRKRKAGVPSRSKDKDDDFDIDGGEQDATTTNTVISAENKDFYDQYMAAFCSDSEDPSQIQAFQQFVSTGGEKCIKFFSGLFNSWYEIIHDDYVL